MLISGAQHSGSTVMDLINKLLVFLGGFGLEREEERGMFSASCENLNHVF